MKEVINKQLQLSKQSTFQLRNLSFYLRNKLINKIAETIDRNRKIILEENQKDLKLMDKENPLYDRLLLDNDRIDGIVQACNELIEIWDPLEKHAIEKNILTKEGLNIRKIWVPLWIVACIYKARPNVTVDMTIMAIKSANAIVLKWWSAAKNSNHILIKLMKEILVENEISPDTIYEFPYDRKYTQYMFQATNTIDVIIPRWSKNLIQTTRENSLVPVIETGAGVVHLYLDKDINKNHIDKAIDIIVNAKISRPSVCNALDTLLVHKWVKKELHEKLAIKLQKYDVKIWIENNELLEKIYSHTYSITDKDYHTEQLALSINIKLVDNLDDAISHITKYSSQHSDGILSDNQENVEQFIKSIDSGVVYSNTSTRFSDGWCFGFGWEIGISTQKLHARWPMGADSLVTYKYIIDSDWKSRK